MRNSFHFFPLWKRGKKGDLTAFQKAKLLQKLTYSVGRASVRQPKNPFKPLTFWRIRMKGSAQKVVLQGPREIIISLGFFLVV
jgi:hypothetical protein